MLMSMSIRPKSIYIEFPFQAIKDNVKKIDAEFVICESDSFIALKYNDDFSLCLYDKGTLIMTYNNNVDIDYLSFNIKDYQDIIRNHIKEFKYELPTEILQYEFLRLMNEYGKLAGNVDNPLFSDREFIKKIKNLF